MEKAEVKYIQVKDHQDEIQVLLLLRRYTHTQPGGLGVQGSFFVTTNDQHGDEATDSARAIFQKGVATNM